MRGGLLILFLHPKSFLLYPTLKICTTQKNPHIRWNAGALVEVQAYRLLILLLGNIIFIKDGAIHPGKGNNAICIGIAIHIEEQQPDTIRIGTR